MQDSSHSPYSFGYFALSCWIHTIYSQTRPLLSRPCLRHLRIKAWRLPQYTRGRLCRSQKWAWTLQTIRDKTEARTSSGTWHKTNKKLLVARCIATRSKDATRAPGPEIHQTHCKLSSRVPEPRCSPSSGLHRLPGLRMPARRLLVQHCEIFE